MQWRRTAAGRSALAVAVGATMAVTMMPLAHAQTRDPLAPLPDRAPQPVVAAAPPAPRAAAAAVAAASSPVAPRTRNFAEYRQQLAARAAKAGIRPATIAAIVPTVQFLPAVVRLDRAQPGGINNPNATPPFAPYRRAHVTTSLITRGAARFAAYRPALQALERRTGVEASVLMAIYGHETNFGSYMGSTDLFDALATLAYEGRRRAFFEDEFIAALKLVERGTPRSRLKGSWAGATGKTQFMPSTVLRLASDGDGDGIADIWTSEMDALASIANYLRNAGWKPFVHWGVAARVPAQFDRAAVQSRLVAPRCPRVYARHSRWLTLREWRALGVVPAAAMYSDTEQLSLLEPDGPGATAYLLSQNYRAILDYNCSNFYALSVGLLADGIVRR